MSSLQPLPSTTAGAPFINPTIHLDVIAATSAIHHCRRKPRQSDDSLGCHPCNLCHPPLPAQASSIRRFTWMSSLQPLPSTTAGASLVNPTIHLDLIAATVVTRGSRCVSIFKMPHFVNQTIHLDVIAATVVTRGSRCVSIFKMPHIINPPIRLNISGKWTYPRIWA